MTYAEAVRSMVQGLRLDTADYQALQELLEQQFQAALRHGTEDLSELSGRITALSQVLEGRRQERMDLSKLLLGGRGMSDRAVSIEAVTLRLPATAQQAFRSEWRALERQVRRCKELNTRNCRLFMGQFEIMQRVLTPESHTYAPI